MKKFYSLVAAVVFAATVNAQTFSVTEVAAEQFGTSTVSNITETVYPIDANLDYSFAANGASNTAFYPADGIRMYSIRATGEGNIMTITPKNGAKITELVVNAFSAAYTPAVTYSIDGGAFVPATWSGTTLTITGIEAATSLAIKNAHTGGSSNTQLRIPTFTVKYDLVTMAVGDVNATKANLVKNTVVSNNILFAAKADVQIVSMNGQVVKSASVNENTSLDVTSLAKGTYIVTGMVNGKAVSQKIIKK